MQPPHTAYCIWSVIAFFNLDLQSQSHGPLSQGSFAKETHHFKVFSTLFNGTWQIRPRELDFRLRFRVSLLHSRISIENLVFQVSFCTFLQMQYNAFFFPNTVECILMSKSSFLGLVLHVPPNAVECIFFSKYSRMHSHVKIQFSRSRSARSVEKRPTRLRLEIEIGDWRLRLSDTPNAVECGFLGIFSTQS